MKKPWDFIGLVLWVLVFCGDEKYARTDAVMLGCFFRFICRNKRREAAFTFYRVEANEKIS
jgi:hypothetical protein